MQVFLHLFRCENSSRFEQRVGKSIDDVIVTNITACHDYVTKSLNGSQNSDVVPSGKRRHSNTLIYFLHRRIFVCFLKTVRSIYFRQRQIWHCYESSISHNLLTQLKTRFKLLIRLLRSAISSTFANDLTKKHNIKSLDKVYSILPSAD